MASNQKPANNKATSTSSPHRKQQEKLARGAHSKQSQLVKGFLVKQKQTIITARFIDSIGYSILLISIFLIIATSTSLINVAFILYIVFVLLKKVSSSQIFIPALLSLIILIIVTSLQHPSIANNIATLAFFFMVVGLMQATLELYRNNNFSKK